MEKLGVEIVITGFQEPIYHSYDHAKIQLLPYLRKLTNNSDEPEAFGIDHSELAWVECWDMWYVWLVVLNDSRFIVAYKLISMSLLFLQRKYEFVPADIPIIKRLKSAWIYKTQMESSLLMTYQSLTIPNKDAPKRIVNGYFKGKREKKQTIISSFLIDLT